MIVLGSFNADKHVVQIRREGHDRGRGERRCHSRSSLGDYDPSRRRRYFDQRLVPTVNLGAYLFDPLQRENNGSIDCDRIDDAAERSSARFVR